MRILCSKEHRGLGRDDCHGGMGTVTGAGGLSLVRGRLSQWELSLGREALRKGK